MVRGDGGSIQIVGRYTLGNCRLIISETINILSIMKEKIEKVITELRPALQADGGDIEFVDVKNDVVKVRLKGACSGCPFSQMTMQNFVAEAIKKNVPSIKAVELVDESRRD